MNGRGQGGFSLLEMAVTMAVFAILAAMALPAWQSFLQAERMNSARDNLLNAIAQARLTAVNNNNVVQLCAYNPASASQCGTSWSAGWAVIEQQSAGAVLLRAASATSTGPVLSNLASGVTTISFNSRPPFVAAAQTGDFKLCDARGASSALSINLQSTGYAQAAASAGYTLGGTRLACP
ncbi:hypothetical protein CEK28_13715 [Xenophilus sp. AP218F]|nr:GspH/FimT family pseudopilin [Chromobacterium sp. ASV5]OWY38318.1 hypothetical protein CEK28_13715 [Xenophilus sp. AP218F]